MKIPDKKTVIIICGPTASGKTAIAIALAKQFHTDIISADSRQCFKELKIGVARPSDEELKQIPHYFIASHSIKESVTAAGFEKFALEKANEIFTKHDIAIMAGGTGLYIKAFCEGLDDIPEVSSDTRERIAASFKKNGLQWLQNEIEQKDPGFYKVGEIQNPQRMMRALEVVESTGRSILDFRKGEKAKRDFNIVKIGLELSKEELHRNIDIRVEAMVGNGLVEEVKSLMEYKNLNALQSVGYSETFDFLEGKISKEVAIDEINKNTRQYAKRQMTWFKKDKEIKWFPPSRLNEIIEYAESKVK